MRKLLRGIFVVLFVFAVVTTAHGSRVPKILFNSDLKAELPSIAIDGQLLDSLREIGEVLGISFSPGDNAGVPETSEPASPPLSSQQLLDLAKPATVKITAITSTKRVGAEILTNYVSGTGFNIDPSGLIVTNSHVISGAQEISVRFANGFTAGAALVADDKENDLALLQLMDKGQTYPSLKLGDSEKIKTGQKITVFGYPLGVEELIASTGTIGNLSNKITGSQVSMMEVTAEIQQGNSGSPVLDERGNVIGIIAATLISETPFYSEQFGGAIPVNTLKKILP